MTTRSKKKPEVLIVMGSDSDWPTLEHTANGLDEFGIPWQVEVCSAHRTPDRAAELASGAAARGVKVIVAAAGGAAHLAGVMAGHSTLPVVGVPVKGWALDGLDSLLSTVQMPGGIPVATMAIGKAGAVNAAVFCAQVIALGRSSLRAGLKRHKRAMATKVRRGNRKIQDALHAGE